MTFRSSSNDGDMSRASQPKSISDPQFIESNDKFCYDIIKYLVHFPNSYGHSCLTNTAE